MGHTMRFPRAISIRTDLTIADCMTDQGVLESVKNVAKRKLESDFTTKSTKKKTKTKAKVGVRPHVYCAQLTVK